MATKCNEKQAAIRYEKVLAMLGDVGVIKRIGLAEMIVSAELSRSMSNAYSVIKSLERLGKVSVVESNKLRLAEQPEPVQEELFAHSVYEAQAPLTFHLEVRGGRLTLAEAKELYKALGRVFA